MPTRRGVERSASKPLSLRPAWAPGGCDDDDDDEEEEDGVDEDKSNMPKPLQMAANCVRN